MECPKVSYLGFIPTENRNYSFFLSFFFLFSFPFSLSCFLSSFLSFFLSSKVDHLFVPLKDLFLFGLWLRSSSSLQGQTKSPGNLFLAFGFSFCHSLGEKFSTSCSFLLIFLSALFLLCNAFKFALQDTWRKKTLNLGCFCSGLLCLRLSDRLLVDTVSSLERLRLY